MDLKILTETPPWDWPEGVGKRLQEILQDRQAAESDRLVATELASDFTVIDDKLVDALLSVLGNSEESESLRATAAISLGPVLEYADMDGFESADDGPISEETFRRTQASLRELYLAAEVPKAVRRRILEAAVRAPEDWHQDAIRAAYTCGDEDWKLTAVFSMRWVRGFDDQILEALDNENDEIHYQAVCAAGNWAVGAAWSHVAGLIAGKETDKALLLAAIDAVACMRPQEAVNILRALTGADDEDIVEAAYEAMAMAGSPLGDEDEDDGLLH